MKLNLTSLVLSVIACALSVILLLKKDKRDFVFVDIKYLFENFEYKKDAQKEFENVLKSRKDQLDSMELSLKQLINEDPKNNVQIENMSQGIRLKYNEFKEDNLAFSQELDKKIYKQLHTYIKEYAKSEEVELVIGEMEDNISLVGYSDVNKSEELLEFVNKKYKNEL